MDVCTNGSNFAPFNNSNMELAIKDTIKRHGSSLTDVANKIGKTRQTLFGIIENGNPSINTLSAIAEAIGADITEFFPKKDAEPELTALVEYQGKFYKASTLNELKEIISSIDIQELNNL